MNRTIRNLNLDDVQTLLDWAAREGWNPGLGDAAAFYAADPAGFFGAFVGDIMVAGMAAVAYDAHFGFIGLYICHPDWRGQGHGKAVWDAGMAYLGDRTIGLDGVPEQQANYASMGFVPAYQSVRMGGALAPSTLRASVAGAPDLAVAMALDAECFPAARPQFLRRWMAPPNRVLASVRDGRTVAYAVVRTCHDGSKIGPLFTRDDGDIAAASAILDQLHGQVQIDVPLAQAGWIARLAERGLSPGFATARMYRGAPPVLAQARVFGISSLELG